MNIYELVFGQPSGQVLCVFHPDTRKSAGISNSGQYNCFACGAKAHDEVGFIAKYFSVSIERAERIKTSLTNLEHYRYNKKPLEQFQVDFLKSIGLNDDVIKKYFFTNSMGKLIYDHRWAGCSVGYTWFNSPALPNHNAGFDKYRYDKNNIGGSLTPYDDVIAYKQLLICEGEKDMLTAKSMGLLNAVAKVGGAITTIVGGLNLIGKDIVICYDCDDKGRQGALQDADILTTRFSCRVKVLELGLGDKEDLNDYFVKYKHTREELLELIKDTPVHVARPVTVQSKLQRFVDSLSKEELAELNTLLNTKKENDNELKHT